MNSDENNNTNNSTGNEEGSEKNGNAAEPEPKINTKKEPGLKVPAIKAAIVVLAAILVLFLVLVFNGNKKIYSAAEYIEQVRGKAIVECDFDLVNYFILTYYNSLASGNTTILEEMFDNPGDVRISADVSRVVEKYDNIKVYVTPGLKENEIAAFVFYELKFKNINTQAPAVDTFYLRYNPNNDSLKIVAGAVDNVEVLGFLNIAAQKEPVRSLLNETNDRLSMALDSDKDLKNLYVVMQSMTDTVLEEGKIPVIEPTDGAAGDAKDKDEKASNQEDSETITENTDE